MDTERKPEQIEACNDDDITSDNYKYCKCFKLRPGSGCKKETRDNQIVMVCKKCQCVDRY